MGWVGMWMCGLERVTPPMISRSDVGRSIFVSAKVGVEVPFSPARK